jgi:putative transcriptional regulator
MVSQHVIDDVARRIAGDIVWSNDASRGLKKWREIFGASKGDIARLMGISQSVISDYEPCYMKRVGGAQELSLLRDMLRA